MPELREREFPLLRPAFPLLRLRCMPPLRALRLRLLEAEEVLRERAISLITFLWV